MTQRQQMWKRKYTNKVWDILEDEYPKVFDAAKRAETQINAFIQIGNESEQTEEYTAWAIAQSFKG